MHVCIFACVRVKLPVNVEDIARKSLEKCSHQNLICVFSPEAVNTVDGVNVNLRVDVNSLTGWTITS